MFQRETISYSTVVNGRNKPHNLPDRGLILLRKKAMLLLHSVGAAMESHTIFANLQSVRRFLEATIIESEAVC